MIDWELYRRAALEYSRLRPRVAVVQVTPAIGVTTVALPADALSVVSTGYGDEFSLIEVLEGAATEAGWAFDGANLVLTPTPAEATPFRVVYLAQHLPNEISQTCPTIPTAHAHYVEDLEQALALEIEADTVESRPVSYSVGQTEVSRENVAGSLRLRSIQLRERVRAALDEPLARWS